jgi:NADH:ubiquinone oxidoreductase subunit 6 (subunit J)
VLALGILCIGAAGIGTTVWSFGSGLAPDSVTYLDMAKSIAAGQGVAHRWAYWEPVYATGMLPTATTLWPPGYPLAIAALVAAGSDPYVAGRLISILSFAIFPLPIYGLSRFFLPPARALICTGVVISLSPVVAFSASVAAESPFLLLSTVSLLYSIRALEAENSWEANYSWLTAGSAAAAAFLLRYVGVACVAGVVITALLPVRSRGRRTRVLELALAAGPGGVVVGAVVLRSWVVSGAPIHALPGADRFWSTIGPSVRGIVGTVIGAKDLFGPYLSLVRPAELALLGGLIAVALYSFWQTCTAGRRHGLPLAGARPSGVIALFIVLGLATAARGTAALGVSLESRYVMVYLPWFFVLVLGWALRVDSGLRPAIASRWVPLACFGWLLCQLAVSGVSLYSEAEGFIEAGRRSPTIAWVKTNIPPAETILADRGADLAYWCPNPVLGLPRRPFSSREVTSWEALDRLADKARARYLVHPFGHPEIPKYHTAEGFRFLRSLDSPERFPERHPVSLSDGVVYRVGSSAR